MLIFISYVVEPFVGFIQERRKHDTYSRLEWATNETLQLQRLAHEELGFGSWKGCAQYVPVTKDDEPLATLDLTDTKHPRLKPASPPCGTLESFSTLVIVKDDRKSSYGSETVNSAWETDLTLSAEQNNRKEADCSEDERTCISVGGNNACQHADWRISGDYSS